jgi:DNA-binding beta-propeller fold protein YncE
MKPPTVQGDSVWSGYRVTTIRPTWRKPATSILLAEPTDTLPGRRPAVLTETAICDPYPGPNQDRYVEWLVAEADRLAMPFLIYFFPSDFFFFPYGFWTLSLQPKLAVSRFDDIVNPPPPPPLPPNQVRNLTFIAHDKDALEDGDSGLITDGLYRPLSVAVSPDGSQVYVAGYLDKALAVFQRKLLSGRLYFVEALKDTTTVDLGLNGAKGVAVSPNGSHVYATGYLEDALATFTRHPVTGRLTFLDVIKDTSTVDRGLNGATGVAVTADSNYEYVYVASDVEDAVAVFRRDLVTETLSFIEAHKDTTAQDLGLNGWRAVAISPDGNNVYVVGYLDDAIATFARNQATGALTFVQVLTDTATDIGLNAATSVAVSPDGGHVYATGELDDALAVFERDENASGALSFVEYKKDTTTVDIGLNGASSVTVSPNGAYVYATGYIDNAVAVFDRNQATGTVTFLEREKDGVDDATDSGLKVDGVLQAKSVAISSDGRYVYVAGYADNAVAAFSTTD